MKKALIALDCSEASRKAAAYAAGILPLIPDCQVLLFSVAADIPYTGEELAQAPAEPEVHGGDDFHKSHACLQDIHRETERLMREGDICASRLQSRIAPNEKGVAQDILRTARAEGCDTIVLGRHYHSRIKELLVGSVCVQILHQANDLTIWVVE